MWKNFEKKLKSQVQGSDYSPLADAIIDRIAHDSYRINIASIGVEHEQTRISGFHQPGQIFPVCQTFGVAAREYSWSVYNENIQVL